MNQDNIIEGNNLFYRLAAFSNNKDSIDKYYSSLLRYEKICESCNAIKEAPLVKLRLAYYFHGMLFVECGNSTGSESEKYQLYRQAEKFFLMALDTTAPKETFRYISTNKIATELLMCYFYRNDYQSARPYLHYLLQAIGNNADNHGLSKNDIYRIWICKMCVYENYLNRQDLDDIICMLQEIYQDMMHGKLDSAECPDNLLTFINTAVLLLSENRFYSEKYYPLCLDLMSLIEKQEERFAPNAYAKISLYRTFTAISYRLNISPEKYTIKCVKAAETKGVSERVRAEVLQQAALFYYEEGKNNRGDKYLNQCLNMLAQVWHANVRDINNTSLYQALEPMQLIFLGCYSSMRKYVADIDFVYEKMLQFKGMASLAERERNRFLRLNSPDDGLIQKTYEAQDKAADFHAGNIYWKTPVFSVDEPITLRGLEAAVAGHFPQDADFIDITLQAVMQAIPDDSAVIEYFFYENDYERNGFDPSSDKEETAIDIYTIYKRNGRCTIKRSTIPDGRYILKRARTFVAILKEESNPSGDYVFADLTDQKEACRKELYHKLIEPVLPYIHAAHQLYIAPDRDLVNLPFEILGPNSDVRLEEEHDIIKIECARDFLFLHTECLHSKGSLIIGNPQYQIREQDYYPIEAGFDGRDGGMDDPFTIGQLPFSEIEAKRVSLRCKSSYYSGSQATKKLLLFAKGYKCIHIATHGSFDFSNMYEASYSSCLLFAGAANYWETGKKSIHYQTGLVTADEISRLDLRSVELVVLSTCFSSMNQVLEDKGFHGLIEAFSAAGVRYVISHLWSADDLSTVILMDHFYYQYAERHQSPPTALNLAKQYLRQATMGQLKKNEWFLYLLKNNVYREDKYIQELRMCHDWERPFAAEKYWGGFSCYRCN